MSTESKKLKVVIDTNVFISGLNFAGTPSKVLELFINDEIKVYISSFILREIERILREKFNWEEERIETIFLFQYLAIPKEIFDQLHLKAGDFLETITQQGKIVMIPRKLTAKALAPFLTKKEQEVLSEAKKKINHIQIDLLHSQGLTKEEIKIACKVGIIDPDQAWWWTEEWQKGEREAIKEVEKVPGGKKEDVGCSK